MEFPKTYGFGGIRQDGWSGSEGGCANVVAEEVGRGQLGGGVEAFED